LSLSTQHWRVAGEPMNHNNRAIMRTPLAWFRFC